MLAFSILAFSMTLCVQLGPLGRHVGRARVAARCVSSSQSGVRKTKGARRVAAAAVFCAPLFSLVEL